MRSQHSNIMGDEHDHSYETKQAEVTKKPKAKYGIIAVAQGDGIKEAFKELGVDYVIDGGQTMNPPTEEFVKAVEKVNAENIIILPNNSNVILTAEQAANLIEGHSVVVVKTKTVAQGYSSLIAFDPTIDLDDNVESMQEVVANMKSGEVTYAVRDTEMNGVQVKTGDYIGISKGKLVVSTKDRIETITKLLSSLIDDNSEIVTIFYGIQVEAQELEEVVDYLSDRFENVEVETIEGKQDIYSYIIAVE